MKQKILALFLGFIISLFFAIITFYPLSGWYGIIGTAFSVLLYGFTWIVPIVGLIIGLTNDKNKIRKLLKSKYINYTIFILSVIIPVISWNIKISNDIFYALCWLTITMIWLIGYFNLKNKLNKLKKTT